jgi:hypothetical protein
MDLLIVVITVWVRQINMVSLPCVEKWFSREKTDLL